MMVAGFQMDIRWEAPRENFDRVEEKMPKVLESGARLLVLPEMFATGFSMNAVEMAEFAEETRVFLARIAREYGLFLLGGYTESAQPRPANCCSLFGPDGEEHLHYRKIHPFSMAGEDRHFVGGESMETASVQGLGITSLICYDLRFPEPFRPAAQDTDLYCVIANWPDPRREAWSTLLRARAIENQAFVLGVNRVGQASGMTYSGDSVLVDPMGRIVADAPPYQEALVAGEASGEEVEKVRAELEFLKDRRPELYTRLETVRASRFS